MVAILATITNTRIKSLSSPPLRVEGQIETAVGVDADGVAEWDFFCHIETR